MAEIETLMPLEALMFCLKKTRRTHSTVSHGVSLNCVHVPFPARHCFQSVAQDLLEAEEARDQSGGAAIFIRYFLCKFDDFKLAKGIVGTVTFTTTTSNHWSSKSVSC